MTRKILILLLLAGAASALEPRITVKEQPQMAFHSNGTQEYAIGYALTVENPSEKNAVLYAIANYTLPPGSSAWETYPDSTEKRGLESAGKIRSGLIQQKSRFEYHYKIIRDKAPVTLNWSASGNELAIRILNTGNKTLALKRLEPDGWKAASASAGRAEGGKIILEGQMIGPFEALTLKIASPSAPGGFRLYLEGRGPLLHGIQIEKVATEARLSVEKHGAAVTATYSNPTEFTQEIAALKILRAETPADFGNAETIWALENRTTAGPGQTIEFTTQDSTEGNRFYWYSVDADTKYAMSEEKGELEIRAEAARQPATPTGFALLGAEKNAPGGLLARILGIIRQLL